MSLKFYQASNPLSISVIDQLPYSQFSTDWFGVSSKENVSFVVALDPTSIWVSVKFPSKVLLHPKDKADSFIEGLWDYDVFELFLCDDVTERYQEFNLSPGGAWWSASFLRYREREGIQQNGIKTWAKNEENGQFHSYLQILRGSLAISFSCSNNSRANVTAILGNPQKFFSHEKLSAPQPDFHIVNQLQQIIILEGGLSS